jgi:preprotein translocase subunit YajC
MGTMILAATTKPTSSSPVWTFLFVAVLVGLFYVLIMRPQRSRQRKAMETQRQVVPGQRIRTTAGMYGTVVSGDDRDVVIEIAPGIEVTMLRRAILDVVQDDAMPSHEDIFPDEAAEPEAEHEAEADTEAEHDDATPPDLKKKP